MDNVAIEVKDLTKTYTRRNQQPVQALGGLSFTVRRGEIFGLLGPNGAGKTTTLKILTTLLLPTSGTATIFGYDVVRQSLDVRRNILVVMQENAVDMYLSVLDNLKTFGRFHGMGWGEIDGRANEAIATFDLDKYRNHKAIDLSGGLKRRLQVAKVFMVESPIVFLDEATTGMDTLNKRKTLDALKDEAGRGRTIVLTTHILDEAEELCDSLVIINHGRAIAAGSPDEIKKLSLRLYTLTMNFERIPEELRNLLESTDRVGLTMSDSAVEVTLRDETDALTLLTKIHRIEPIKHFEITGASLEDVFVNLVDEAREQHLSRPGRSSTPEEEQ
jgi:ABC-2 type transport system ATP-binding protein